LYFLSLQQRSELNCESHEIVVVKQIFPKCAPLAIATEAPQMNELVEWSGVRNEVTNQELRVTSSFEGWPSLVGVQLQDLAHLADVYVVGSAFVQF
jgi:hypothetical protein